MAKRQMLELGKEVYSSKSSIPMAKAGVTTSLGYNFYDLRGPAILAYPVHTPIRNMLPRSGAVNAGVGLMANWKTNRNPGYTWAGAVEGQRAQIGTPDETDYVAKYAEIGHERQVTFTAQWAGEGFTDNMADEHIRGLNVLFLQEESMILNGNSGTGTGHNGFAIGTAATPTCSVIATVTTAATLGPTGYNCSPSSGAAYLPYTAAFVNTDVAGVCVVALTAMGNPANQQYGYVATPTIAAGLVTSYTYSAPGTGTTITVNGGTSAISLISASQTLTTSNLTIKASIPSVKGAYGYAWFVDKRATPAVATATLAGITTSPTAYINGTATGTYLGNATGLSSDHSFNATEFDGLLTYAANSGYYVDLGGASLTSGKNGRVVELETLLQNQFQNYQLTPTRFWVSPDVAISLDQAVRYSGTGTGGSFSGMQFIYTRDGQNNLLGGFVVSGYQSRFAVANPTGATVIPISIHPMMPTGTLFADYETNPYPTSRAPYSRGIMEQRSYYGVEWPMVQRAWPWGSYCHLTLAHYFPWLTAVITGIGVFVGN